MMSVSCSLSSVLCCLGCSAISFFKLKLPAYSTLDIMTTQILYVCYVLLLFFTMFYVIDSWCLRVFLILVRPSITALQSVYCVSDALLSRLFLILFLVPVCFICFISDLDGGGGGTVDINVD